ncbi:hypothetical protein [Streptomyces himalayensis]|uniref:Uncharacterized protein n=1 Tax=Streptomyces himalayensis subsp. himalayensis TaxID=2756131 RepID=A0A7W0IDC9_9ACTN|nr:hypothetical protein [Streptomyces himalayensis]MBA2951603.1 hypothetical protein [Streptomyces himalayensis subsp. himalayensis]
MDLTLGIEGGPRDGGEITVPVGDHGRPAGEQTIGGARYVLRMFGAPPHDDADWHYCWVRP